MPNPSVIDPDGGGDYVSLAAWAAANCGHTGTDFVTDTVIPIAQCTKSGSTNDTTDVTFSGFTMDATYHPKITQTDFPSDGVYDSAQYVMTGAIKGGQNNGYLTIDKLQCSGNNTATSINYTWTALYNKIIGPGWYLYYNGSNPHYTLINCILDGGRVDRAQAHLYNCTFYEASTYCIRDDLARMDIRNTIFIGTDAGDVFFTTTTSSVGWSNENCLCNCHWNDSFTWQQYEVSSHGGYLYRSVAANNINHEPDTTPADDAYWYYIGTDTNGQSPLGGSIANELTAPATDDFSLVEGGNAIDNGQNLSGNGVTDDVVDYDRTTGTYDIGAHEFPSGGTAIQLFMHHYTKNIGTR